MTTVNTCAWWQTNSLRASLVSDTVCLHDSEWKFFKTVHRLRCWNRIFVFANTIVLKVTQINHSKVADNKAFVRGAGT